MEPAVQPLWAADVVGDTNLVRIISIAEAASGLGVCTAAIGYLPAIYTVISELPTAARSTSDLLLKQASHAAELVIHGGSSAVDGVRRDVITSRRSCSRCCRSAFPVADDVTALRTRVDASFGREALSSISRPA